MSTTRFVRVNSDTLEVVWKYTGGEKLEEDDLECTIPFDVLAEQAVLVDGTITLVEDPVKVQAKFDTQWASVRALRNTLLAQSDWTCSVVDNVPPNRDAWVMYRAELRDVTKQPDPFNITWPPKP
jgi:hypothetical protein